MKVFERLDRAPPLAPEEEQLLEQVRALSRNEIAPRAAELDREARFPHDNVAAINALGLNAMFVPEEYGGARLSYIAYLECVREISKACAATGIVWATNFHAIKPLIDEIKQGRGDITPDGAFLGVSMIAVDDMLEGVRNEFGVITDQGVFVTDLVPGSAAEVAGLDLGDVIIDVDGEEVHTPTDVASIVRSREPGDQLTMRVERDGDVREVVAVLQARADSGG